MRIIKNPEISISGKFQNFEYSDLLDFRKIKNCFHYTIKYLIYENERICMNRLMALLIGAVIVSAIVVLSVVYFPSATNTQVTSVRLGDIPLTISLPIYVAQEEGYFKEQGLDVSLTHFQSSNDLADAAAAGAIDGGGVLSISVVLAVEQKAPNTLKVVTEQVTSSNSPFDALVVHKDSNLTINDLAGKKIALFPGSTSLILAKISFEHLVGSDFKYQPVPMTPNLMLESLASHQVDAVIGYEPFNTLVVQKGVGKVLLSGFYEKGIYDDLPGGAIILTSDFVQKNPQAAAKINVVIGKAIKFIETNETQARIIATKYMPIDESVALKSNLPRWYTAENIDVDKLQKYADIIYNSGGLAEHIGVSSVIYQVPK